MSHAAVQPGQADPGQPLPDERLEDGEERSELRHHYDLLPRPVSSDPEQLPQHGVHLAAGLLHLDILQVGEESFASSVSLRYWFNQLGLLDLLLTKRTVRRSVGEEESLDTDSTEDVTTGRDDGQTEI